MLGVLVESRRARERSLGGTMFSVGIHVVLIAVAVATTVRADSQRFADEDPPPLVFHVVAPATGTPVMPNAAGTGKASLRLPPSFDADVDLPPVSGPTIDLPPIAFGDPYGSSARGNTPVGGGAIVDNTIHFEWMVDVLAVPRSGNPSPAYPRALREAGIEGTVLAQFVVDTSGRVDTSSIRSLAATHVLFEQSVRDAIARMRFTPAESGGRKVRLLVQQSFAFRLGR